MRLPTATQGWSRRSRQDRIGADGETEPAMPRDIPEATVSKPESARGHERFLLWKGLPERENTNVSRPLAALGQATDAVGNDEKPRRLCRFRAEFRLQNTPSAGAWSRFRGSRRTEPTLIRNAVVWPPPATIMVRGSSRAARRSPLPQPPRTRPWSPRRPAASQQAAGRSG